jgi:RNA polymerase sigma factor for flagellar operon FliA
VDDELAGVWDDLRERRTPEALEKLVLRYRPLLDEVAGRIEAEWPTPTDQGNLRSYGLFGLIDAIQTWTGPPEDFDAYGRETADRSIREGLERRPPRDGPEPA